MVMYKYFVFALVAALSLFSTYTFSQTGSLDMSFGRGGKVLVKPANNSGSASAVAIQVDGKIVTAGLAFAFSGGGFAVMRFKQNGEVDSSFGTNGLTGKAINRYDQVAALAIQPDGKIVVGGSTNPGIYTGERNFVILRFLSNGPIDSSFGNNGLAWFDFLHPVGISAEIHSILTSLFIKPNGNILACGYTRDFFLIPNQTFSMVELKPNGTRDSSFGVNGYVIVPSGSMNTSSAALLADGRIINGGSVLSGAFVGRFGARRYLVNGMIDSTFGVNGISETIRDFDSHRVTVQPDGKMVFIGELIADTNIALVRYDSLGHLDNSFGDSGIAIVPQTPNDWDYGTGIHSITNGKLLATGTINHHFSVLKFNNDGSFDNSFGTAGLVTTAVGDSSSYSAASVIQTDGKVLLAGSALNQLVGNIALARYEGNVYPLTLLSFTVQSQKEGNILSWSTTNELNFDKFEIERSANVMEFYPIAKVNKKAQNTSIFKYTFTDNLPIAGDNYYRLKMFDKDATFTYSPVRAIKNISTSYVTVFPNPAKDKIHLKAKDNKCILKLQVISIDGRILLTNNWNVQETNPEKTTDISLLTKGTYYLLITLLDNTKNIFKITKI